MHRLLRFRGPGNDTQLGTQRIGQRHDERELWPYLARGEQAPHAGGVAIDPPRQLGLGYAQVDPERVKLPDTTSVWATSRAARSYAARYSGSCVRRSRRRSCMPTSSICEVTAAPLKVLRR